MNAAATPRPRRRANSSRTSGRRRTSGTPRWYPTRRRRRPGLASTVGTALGTLAVSTLLNLSWPARIGLLVLALVLGLGYMLWKHRAEIAAGATEPDPPATLTDSAGPAGPGGSVQPGGPQDASLARPSTPENPA